MIPSSGTCACDQSSPVVVLYYSFVSGLLAGFGLVIVWVYWMYKRSKSRAQMVSEVAQIFDRETLSKIFKILNPNGESVPSHISFPEYEKVGWLNKVLAKLWPFAKEATEQWAKMELEPMLETYRPPRISKVTLGNFHIGNAPPRIEGVKIQSLLELRQVQIDMDFKWCGDGEISLRVTLPTGAMSTEFPVLKLRGMSFNATIRVILQLADEMPCISALVFSKRFSNCLQYKKLHISYITSPNGVSQSSPIR